jgi:hypothetical protein
LDSKKKSRKANKSRKVQQKDEWSGKENKREFGELK